MSGREATTASFRARPIPAWYDDAKLGIFVHWGIYSVPAWAPTIGNVWEVGPEEQPYTEWYANKLRIEGSSTAAYHARVWGSEFRYEQFAPIFNEAIAAWKPDAWADLFSRAGAGYVVLTSKHHDGFLLWPSHHRNPRAPDFIASRDLVGELTDAVRERGLRMGLYYSGGIDWLWDPAVIRSLGDLVTACPSEPAYERYATNHWKELIDRYRPCSMWNDISFPGELERIEELFAFYYERVPDGIVNDRFRMTLTPQGLGSLLPHDVTTPEYQAVEEIRAKKWEAVRGIGNSFGYNRAEGEEHYLSPDELIASFVDTVSKNGNLLLNVGPTAEGEIPAAQRERLQALGDWLRVNGDAIYGTRPWWRAEGRTADAGGVRFTQKGGRLYAILIGLPNGRRVQLPDLAVRDGARVALLGHGPVEWSREGDGILLELPSRLPCAHALALRIDGQVEEASA